jgi:hypothetical protein
MNSNQATLGEKKKLLPDARGPWRSNRTAQRPQLKANPYNHQSLDANIIDFNRSLSYSEEAA